MSSESLSAPGSEQETGGNDLPVTADLLADGTAVLDGRQLELADGEDARRALMLEAASVAAERGRPVLVVTTITGRGGTTVARLMAHPDGLLVPVTDEDLADEVAEPAAEPADEVAEELGPADQVEETNQVEETDQVEKAAPDVPVPGYAEDDPRGALVAALAADGLGARPVTAPRGIAVPVSPADTTGRPAPAGPDVVWRAHPRRRRRPMILGVVAMAIAGAAAATVFLQASLPFRLDSPAAGNPADGRGDLDAFASAVAAGPVSLQGVAVPPGTSTTPRWSVPVAEWTRTVVAGDGSLVTRTPDGRVLRMRADRGQVLWASAEVTSREQDGPWTTTLAGVPVAAVVDRSMLTYWPLGTAAGASAPASATTSATSSSARRAPVVAGVSVDLPVGASVSWVGTSPLLTLRDGRAAVVADDQVIPVTLPPGVQALAADGTTVLAVSSTGWIRQPAAQPAATDQPYPRPVGSAGGPLRVEAVGGSLLLTVWAQATGTGQVVALVDTTNLRLLAQVTLAEGIDLQHARLLRESGGTQTLLGSVLVDTYTPALDVLDPAYVVAALGRGHAWATRDGQAVDIKLDNGNGDFVVAPFTPGLPAVPVGVVPAATGAGPLTLVTAPGDSGWLLAALPQA